MYPREQLDREAAFIAYYYHWTLDEIYVLEHQERRKCCEQISQIHKIINNDPKNIFDV